MKRRKYWLWLSIVFFMLIVIIVMIKIKSNLFTQSKDDWKNVRAVPFDGYIGGYEYEKTFLQLPIFLPQKETIDIKDVRSIVMCGDKELPCTNFQLSNYHNSKVEGYKFATLSFKVQLPEMGGYVFNSLKILLDNEDIIEWKLGSIEIQVIKKIYSDDILSMSQFIVNQADMNNFKISYINNTEYNIVLDKFLFPDDWLADLQITMYKDFQLKNKEDTLTIPAHEERTFLINTNSKKDKNEKIFYFVLPFVSYKYNGDIMQMPAQTQATIVQMPFSEEFILELMESKKY